MRLFAPFLLAFSLLAQPRITPHHPDLAYGPHERNRLDLWLAKSSSPTPLMLIIHGGGFVGGDKRNIPYDLVQQALDRGFSVASLNYRFAQHAKYPAAMEDSGLAVQYLRAHADKYNLDPQRVFCTGGSAGAMICLWLGYRADRAEPTSSDPIARQSTRFTALALIGAQTFIEPKMLREIIGEAAAKHPSIPFFLGFPPEELYSEKAAALARDAQSITWLTKDDPPTFLYYSDPRGPLPPNARPGDGIHHPAFGDFLKPKLDALGIPCVVRHQDQLAGYSVAQEIVAFLAQQLKADPARN